jgi:hypothetical protein
MSRSYEFSDLSAFEVIDVDLYLYACQITDFSNTAALGSNNRHMAFKLLQRLC